MRANELMLGDWVLYNPNVFIEDEYELPKDCYPTKISCGEDIDLAIEDCYSPIPLTAEILEKNGFVYKEAEETCATEAFHHWWLDGSLFALNDDSWWRSIKDGKLRVKFGGFPLEYVHQLQHALRLCGIEKEIEI